MEPASESEFLSLGALEKLMNDSGVPITEGDPALNRQAQVPEEWTINLTTNKTSRSSLKIDNLDLDSNKNKSGGQLEAQDEMHQTDIDYRDASELSYEEFVVEYMAKNRPVLIKGCTAHWRAAKDWVTSKGKIDIDALNQECGESKVCVTDTKRCNAGCGETEEMTVADYCCWWKNREKGILELKYLKDWHCAAEENRKPFYKLPHYFHEDWLNEYLDAVTQKKSETVTSDYRFVYLGPKGSWTPLHADVLRSYSWSTNVCGKKRWCLLHPDFTFMLCDARGREMAPDFDLSGMDLEAAEKFPHLESARHNMIEVIQEVGDAIFVPSGWHHSVHNLEDTLSINHNWLNGFNIKWSWALLKQKYKEARAAIFDCRSLCSEEEFEGLVQKNLKADCGMDFGEFLAFLAFISKKRRELIAQGGVGNGRKLMAKLSLQQICRVLEDMHTFQDLNVDAPLCCPTQELEAIHTELHI